MGPSDGDIVETSPFVGSTLGLAVGDEVTGADVTLFPIVGTMLGLDVGDEVTGDAVTGTGAGVVGDDTGALVVGDGV